VNGYFSIRLRELAVLMLVKGNELERNTVVVINGPMGSVADKSSVQQANLSAQQPDSTQQLDSTVIASQSDTGSENAINTPSFGEESDDAAKKAPDSDALSGANTAESV
jgi:hypothetical protein